MKLLLDSAFPISAESRGNSGVELLRWTGGEIPDSELLRKADEDGFDGVVFIGNSAAARPDIQAALDELPRIVVIVHAEVPSKAVRHLEANLAQLRSTARPGGIYIVLTDEVSLL